MNRIVLAVLLAILAAGSAFGDGVYFAKRGVVAEPRQEAIIVHSDGVEDLVLRVAYRGASDSFAWFVPTPSRPEVSAAPTGLFEELEAYSRRRSGLDRVRRRPDLGLGGARAMSAGGVQVLERKRVSVHDVAVLEASDSAALLRWLDENGFVAAANTAAVFGEYLAKGWVFTAVRIHPGAAAGPYGFGAGSGTLPPLRFSFKSKGPVYPLKISSLNSGTTKVTLYVFAEHPCVHRDFGLRCPPLLSRSLSEAGPTPADGRSDWAKQWYDSAAFFYRPIGPGELDKHRASLPNLAGKALYLSRLDASFTEREMTSDILLADPKRMGEAEQRNYARSRLSDRHGPVTLALAMAGGYLLEAQSHLRAGRPLTPAAWSEAFLVLAIARPAGYEDVLAQAAMGGDTGTQFALADVLQRVLHGRSWPRPEVSGRDALVPILLQIARATGGVARAQALQTLGTIGGDEARKALVALGMGEFQRVRSGLEQSPTRRLPLLYALARVPGEESVTLYRRMLNEASENLTGEDVRACLIGLGHLESHSAEVLVSKFGTLAEERGDKRAVELAREIAQGPNRIGPAQPYLMDGMNVDELDALMGQPGRCLGKSGAPENTLKVYRWASLRANFKNDALVSWKWH